MKYLRLKNRGFVIFEEGQSHKEIAEMLGDEVASAGFMFVDDPGTGPRVCCNGDSFSLKKNCDPFDAERIFRRLVERTEP